MIDFSKVKFEVPQIRTARLIEGKWQVLDSIANAIIIEAKLKHYDRAVKELNKGKV